MPLSDVALDVSEQAKCHHNCSKLMCPSPLKPGRPLSDMTLRPCNYNLHSSIPGGISSRFNTPPTSRILPTFAFNNLLMRFQPEAR